MAGAWGLLLEVVILLATCLVFGAILSRLGQSPLVGYLLAGMILGGPGSVGVVHSTAHIEAIAELGVALLLFGLGLEFSFKYFRALGGRVLLAGASQVVVTAAVVAGAGRLLGLGGGEAIAVGAMLCLSSTAAVLRILSDRGELDSPQGRDSIAVLLVQDASVVPLALLMAFLGSSGDGPAVSAPVLLGLAVAFVAALYVLLNVVGARVLRALSLERNRELSLLLAVVVGLGSTWCAHAIGLSPALGAFLAGMFLGGSPFATRVRADVASIRVVLLTLFFGAVGMVADPIWILRHLPLVLLVAGVAVLGKALLTGGILRLFGRPLGCAMAAGLCLSQVGEFAFVLGATGRAGGVVSESTYLLVVSVTIATLFATPFLVSAAARVGGIIGRFRRSTPAADPAEGSKAPAPEVLIVGYGPAGRAVGRALAHLGTLVRVLDLNPQAAADADALGLMGEIADGSQPEALEHAGVAGARLVVITLPDRQAANTVLAHVRALAPNAQVVVRSRHSIHRDRFRAAGAHAVVGDEEEVGRGLADAALARLRATGG